MHYNVHAIILYHIAMLALMNLVRDAPAKLAQLDNTRYEHWVCVLAVCVCVFGGTPSPFLFCLIHVDSLYHISISLSLATTLSRYYYHTHTLVYQPSSGFTGSSCTYCAAGHYAASSGSTSWYTHT
jgi:hypothetical protein